MSSLLRFISKFVGSGGEAAKEASKSVAKDRIQWMVQQRIGEFRRFLSPSRDLSSPSSWLTSSPEASLKEGAKSEAQTLHGSSFTKVVAADQDVRKADPELVAKPIAKPVATPIATADPKPVEPKVAEKTKTSPKQSTVLTSTPLVSASRPIIAAAAPIIPSQANTAIKKPRATKKTVSTSLLTIKGLGIATNAKLKRVGIQTIEDFARVSDADLAAHCAALSLSLPQMRRLRDQAIDTVLLSKT